MRKAVFKSKKIKTDFGRRLLSIRKRAIKNGMTLKSADEILDRKENGMFGDWKDTNDYRLVTDDWANSWDLGKEENINDIKSLIRIRMNKIEQIADLQNELTKINIKLEDHLRDILFDRKIDFYYFSVTYFSILRFSIAIPTSGIIRDDNENEMIKKTKEEAVKVKHLLEELGLSVTKFFVNYLGGDFVEWTYELQINDKE